MEDFTDRLLSRKFLLPILFAVVVSLNETFGLGLSETETTQVFKLFLAFIGAEGGADLISRYVEQ